ncbi:MAG: DNA-processing protein DprA [Actinomycetota bacterium]|nr:DNA-processing protein DprA [Actinomycetota bacterium]
MTRTTHLWRVGEPDYPIRDEVPDRPPMLRGEGEGVDAFRAPRVAIVGTRAATPQGLADAHEIGAYLASAGVTIVSGLAIGIDGAAHEGCLDADGLAVGVVATGLDVEYPRRHRKLYARVRTSGLVVSEHPYGVLPRPERFPVRNRIIAALCDVCVVVEATISGGSRITAEKAADYGRPVFALPGSRRNPAAAGCNALIADGALCLLDPSDVLLALGHGIAAQGWHASADVYGPDERQVLMAFAGEAASVDQILGRTTIGGPRVAAAIRRLEQVGAVQHARGRWWPR